MISRTSSSDESLHNSRENIFISRTPPLPKPKSSCLEILLDALKPFSASDSESEEAQETVEENGDGSQSPLEKLYSILEVSVEQRLELSRLTTSVFPDPEEFIPLSDEERKSDDIGIRAASSTQLIILLTSPKYSNVHFQKKFLLSSPSFIQPQYLLAALFTRYFIDIRTPHCNVESDEELNTVRSRIIAILRSWITSLPYQFNDRMIEAFRTFMYDTFTSRDPKSAQGLNLQAGLDAFYGIKSNTTITVKKPIPPSILPNEPKEEWTIELIDPEELARQITLYHSQIFRDIGPTELLTSIWSSVKGGGSKNIELLQNHFDILSRFVSKDIISRSDAKERGRRYNYWYEVSKHFNEQKNYNGLFSTIIGLTHPCVKRQTQTMKYGLKYVGKQKSTLDTLISICEISGDFKNYRPIINKAADCCVPFIGCFQKDLVYIQESYPNKIGELINFKKCVACVNLINQISQFQNERYYFQPVDTIQHLITTLPPPLDTKDLMIMSRQIEPPVEN